MHAKRSVRVAELLKREISQILIKEINDPLISLVTISTVKVTDDLKYAKIYFTVLGDKENRLRVSERLERATKFIKNLIGNRLKLRYVPELKFQYDTLADHVEHIEELFLKIKKEENNQI